MVFVFPIARCLILNPEKLYLKRSSLFRIYYIDNKVKNNKYPNTRQIAEELEVSKRTIQRDIEFMRDRFGASLEFCYKNKGYYYSQDDFSLGLLRLTEGELIALYLGHNLLKKCEGTPYEKHVISAFQKICCNLQDIVSIDFKEVMEAISFDFEPLRGDEEKVAKYFNLISKAVTAKRSIEIIYYSISKDRETRRLTDPYNLRYYHGAWYVVAYCHLRNQVRIFALDRIREIIPTKKNFCIPDNHTVDSFFNDAFQFFKGEKSQAVRIWFSSHKARWIKEKTWHPSQKLEIQEDGSIILEITSSGIESLIRWIMSFGSNSRVISPQWLVEEVKSEIKKLQELYLDK
ncbi:MAG: hypothetical protein CVU88_04910 [Firmicutes bacterium HGW-Firmicutes-13]|nr:MAG: hypothetical protein CVU88_04910 [Firmicutes bacterium HGW-Firmicutes-13]